ncbi:MAG TPA: insulinase family protein, partial [Aggregatilineales bacterium]|nr:insulinase family protein [Aggregatilineales bacterium]
YAAFKRYHEIYYHPSNAMFYFYGDDDPAKRFELLEGYLKDFEAISIEKKPDVQPRWNAPRRQTFTYEGGEDAKAYVTLNWLLTDGENAEESLALGILNHILNGTPASPLQKALIESGLGEGLSGGGLDRDVYQYYYSLGLKNTATDAAASVETLMLNTLRDLVDNGIDPEMIEASMNTVEFSLRELNTGGFPRGLALFVATLRTWTYGGDPLAPISFEAPLNAIKARIARGEAYFESLIRRYFVDNPHRLTMSLIPEGGYQMNLEAAERARLDAIRAAMSGAQIEEVIAETHALREAQETPDAPESLALLPTVQLSDIDKQNKAIPITVGSAGGVPVVYHDIFTNGIAYIDVGFSLFALPMNYLPLLNLFSTALLEMGTQREDYVKFTQRIGRKTGGIDVSTLLSPMRTNRNESVAYLMVRGKGTTGQIADLLALYEDLLLNVKFDQQERFKQITLEAKSGLESFLLPGGARVINDRMRAGFNTIDWAEDEMGGVGQLFYLRDLIAQIETDWASVLAKLEDMRRLLINRTTMIINVTLDSGNYAKTFPQIEAFAAKLPSAAPRLAPWTPTLQPRSEGLSLPAQVNYVGWAGDLFSESYGVHGSYIAANNFLNSGYLWERIRMQGGAYGGFCAFDRFTGVWTFMSYRDPNTVNSLKAYQGTGAYLKALDLPERELQRIIIGGGSLMDAHLLPDAKGYTSFTRYLVGETDAMRQTMREQLLGTTLKDFQRLGEVLDAAYPKGITAILGSASAVDTVNDYIGGGLAVTKIG